MHALLEHCWLEVLPRSPESQCTAHNASASEVTLCCRGPQQPQMLDSHPVLRLTGQPSSGGRAHQRMTLLQSQQTKLKLPPYK